MTFHYFLVEYRSSYIPNIPVPIPIQSTFSSLISTFTSSIHAQLALYNTLILCWGLTEKYNDHRSYTESKKKTERRCEVGRKLESMVFLKKGGKCFKKHSCPSVTIPFLPPLQVLLHLHGNDSSSRGSLLGPANQSKFILSDLIHSLMILFKAFVLTIPSP